MKNIFILLILMSLSTFIWAGDYGALGALSQKEFTLDEMLDYAMEDEHLALREYQSIMEKFDIDRPYGNIARSELTHISYLEKLYADYNREIPEIDALNHVDIPASLSEAAEIGVQAEVNNIAMYEKLLTQELPSDVRVVFEALKKGSENHLRAFQRLALNPTGRNKNS